MCLWRLRPAAARHRQSTLDRRREQFPMAECADSAGVPNARSVGHYLARLRNGLSGDLDWIYLRTLNWNLDLISVCGR